MDAGNGGGTCSLNTAEPTLPSTSFECASKFYLAVLCAAPVFNQVEFTPRQTTLAFTATLSPTHLLASITTMPTRKLLILAALSF